MAIDNLTGQQVVHVPPSQESGHGMKFIVIFLVLAGLAGGEFYALNRTSTTRSDLVTQQNQLRKELTAQIQDQVSIRLAAMEQQTTEQLDAVTTELDKSARRLGSQGGELKKARTMVTGLQDEQRKQTEEFQTQLSQKADEQQVGTLTQDVSLTKTDLDTTKKNVSSIAGDEVAQLYLEFPAVPGAPLRALRGFERVHLEPGASQTVRFELQPRDLSMVTEAGQPIVAEGAYTVSVGGGQPDTGAPAVAGGFTVKGRLALPE